jgi:phosphoserine aminotransferase
MLIGKNNHFGLNFIRILLVPVLLVFWSFAHIAAASSSDGADSKVQVKALDGIPQDLAIVYGTGATHANWGRTTYRISADGKATYEKTRGMGSKGTREKKEYALTAEELTLIMKKIKDARFFSLEESYADPKIRDGWSSYLTVTMDGKTHGVSIRNTHQKEFDAVAGIISKTIGDKEPVSE